MNKINEDENEINEDENELNDDMNEMNDDVNELNDDINKINENANNVYYNLNNNNFRRIFRSKTQKQQIFLNNFTFKITLGINSNIPGYLKLDRFAKYPVP